MEEVVRRLQRRRSIVHFIIMSMSSILGNYGVMEGNGRNGGDMVEVACLSCVFILDRMM